MRDVGIRQSKLYHLKVRNEYSKSETIHLFVPNQIVSIFEVITEKPKKSVLLCILISVGITLLAIGELNHLMHWPFRIQFIIASVTFFFCAIVLMIFKMIKKKNLAQSDLSKILLIMTILGVKVVQLLDTSFYLVIGGFILASFSLWIDSLNQLRMMKIQSVQKFQD